MIEAVRTASSSDLAFLASCEAAMADELTPMRGGSLWRRHDARTIPLADVVAAADATVLIGTIDDAVVASAVMCVEALHDGASLAVISDLFVDPDARSVGIGDALVAALIDDARRRGCIGIDATALPGHRSAKNFFEGQGFVARSLTMHHPLTDEP